MEFAHRAKTTPASDAIRRLRSQVLAHLTKLGMYALPEDWTKVNRFLLQRRICGRRSICSMLQTQALVRKLAGHRRQEARHDLTAFGSGDADLHHSGRRSDRGELT